MPLKQTKAKIQKGKAENWWSLQLTSWPGSRLLAVQTSVLTWMSQHFLKSLTFVELKLKKQIQLIKTLEIQFSVFYLELKNNQFRPFFSVDFDFSLILSQSVRVLGMMTVRFFLQCCFCWLTPGVRAERPVSGTDPGTEPRSCVCARAHVCVSRENRDGFDIAYNLVEIKHHGADK